ncbi:ImmA/IrrE family metallo-endopeptidase [Weissella minor]|nr:ImmA/IrrE family metallo-endopeptidase [Weissella minor]
MTNKVDNVIEEFKKEYPNVKVSPRVKCPIGWDGATIFPKDNNQKILVVYNAELVESEQLETLEHEFGHIRDSDDEYTQSVEYQAEINTAMGMINEQDLTSYAIENPELNDFDIADHFRVSIDQLRRCVDAYQIKGIKIGNSVTPSPELFYRAN